ncbi:hypothetical protein [Thiomicrospira sp. S5]|jgi:hypothetical protein|uniref:hypothetical protein n=1 Tax=Thiomicrospira sp. S5 TaxID=1803865 RepID=UPI0004A743F2|nr:hypothetical protein [Thiomicrospira sp. S5]AZR82807.1 hypothetical protein AYJ59_11280 [Thiomicrospira sp. S5]
MGIFSGAYPVGKVKWERVEGLGAIKMDLYRTKIVGGWLVTFSAGNAATGSGSGGLTFISDPEHSWDGSSLNLEEVK